MMSLLVKFFTLLNIFEQLKLFEARLRRTQSSSKGELLAGIQIPM